MGEGIGVYALYFESLIDKVYIGSTTRLMTRHQEHLSALKRNCHFNYKVQARYNLCKETPIFYLLEGCKKEELYAKEAEWVEEFDSFNEGFNLTLSGKSGALMGASAPSALYTKEDYIEILYNLVYTSDTQRVIADRLGISIGLINSLSSGASHAWLKEACPIEYQVLLDTRKDRRERAYTNISNNSITEYPRILSPTGIEYEVTNTCKFAKQHTLDQGNLHRVLTGKYKSTKGWRLKV